MRFGNNQAIIWLFVVLSAAAFVVVTLVFRPVGADKREAITKQVAQLKTEASSRNPPRSILRGMPDSGNAWEEYNIALNDAAMWRDDENGGVFVRFAKGDSDVDRANVQRLVAEHSWV